MIEYGLPTEFKTEIEDFVEKNVGTDLNQARWALYKSFNIEGALGKLKTSGVDVNLYIRI